MPATTMENLPNLPPHRQLPLPQIHPMQVLLLRGQRRRLNYRRVSSPKTFPFRDGIVHRAETRRRFLAIDLGNIPSNQLHHQVENVHLYVRPSCLSQIRLRVLVSVCANDLHRQNPFRHSCLDESPNLHRPQVKSIVRSFSKKRSRKS